MIIGLGVFITAIVAKSDDLKRTSLGIFFAISLLSIPAFVTGTSAKLALDKVPEVSKTMIDTHETAAFEALGVMEADGRLGVAGALAVSALIPLAAVDGDGGPAAGAGDLRLDVQGRTASAGRSGTRRFALIRPRRRPQVGSRGGKSAAGESDRGCDGRTSHGAGRPARRFISWGYPSCSAS